MNKETLFSKAIIIGSAMAAGILFLQGVNNILEAGGFVSPIYQPDDGTGQNPTGPIPLDLLGELQIIMAGFILVNGYITSKRYQMIKQVKNLDERITRLEERRKELVE